MRFSSLPRQVALYGLVLNAAWEFGQCTFLFGMWEWAFWKSMVWMWGAILGDVLIVLGITYLAYALAGPHHLIPLDRKGWFTLFVIGFVASVFLEWIARFLGLWTYGPLMPTLRIFDETVGLSPIIQVTILPALSVYLATRRITAS
jgi:hypothetical protein